MKDPSNIEADKSFRLFTLIFFNELTLRYQTILSDCRLFSFVGRAFAITACMFLAITRKPVSSRKARYAVKDNHLSDLLHCYLFDPAGEAECLGKEVVRRLEKIF